VPGKRKLRLPAVLVASVVGAGGACHLTCGEEHHYHCFPEDPADAAPGAPDADPSVADAAPIMCPDEVERPEDCPPGCIPLG
jgi:hypothetical protein